MRKHILCFILIASLFSGCGTLATYDPASTDARYEHLNEAGAQTEGVASSAEKGKEQKKDQK